MLYIVCKNLLIRNVGCVVKVFCTIPHMAQLNCKALLPGCMSFLCKNLGMGPVDSHVTSSSVAQSHTRVTSFSAIFRAFGVSS